MTTAQLLVLLLVIVVAIALVWLLVRRSAARKDGARAEAAGLRVEAEGLAGTLAGQEAFAEQAEDRAGVAQAEADRLADEASQYRETVEVTRTDYRSMLARADEVDPDVSTPAAGEDERRPMTRAEARQMREEAERAAWAGSPAAPVPGAAGAAVMGRDTGGVSFGPPVAEPEVDEQPPTAEEPVVAEPAVADDAVAEEPVLEEPGADESTALDAPEQEAEQQPVDAGSEERSARIAAATDFRDDEEDEPYVWGASRAGTEEAMDERPAEPDDQTPTAASDAEAPTSDWGGPHVAAAEAATDADTEPRAADAQPEAAEDAQPESAEDAQPESAEDAQPESAEDAQPEAEEATTPEADAPTEEAEMVDDPGAGAFTEHEEPDVEEADAYDPTPERDWSADEGELLEESSAKADELAAEREQMDRDAAAAGMEPVHPEVVEQAEAEADEAPAEEPVTDENVADEASTEAETPAEEPVADEPAADEAPTEDETPTEAPAEDEPRAPRRVSEFHEIRDGGYGMGSAAALDDGAQPMDHPVQAYRDTMTYRVPGDPGYDDATADVWFYDQGAAERSGFRRSDG
ncbi:sunset domain-containing protein [Phycicoccus sonneratiae]|uniref:Uncharacterized protein n=1 Tax=Phycicoccus sonneratiae TaxID=2807628 RepID=A0ABS2CRF5_9MICO|nr:hypothetical protein [Phycicoccus sonneraticus]MBM6402398.1 hypothetical protein [Phycicoccus sonneraticus]